MQGIAKNVVIEHKIVDLFSNSFSLFPNHCADYCNVLFFKKQQNMIVTTLFFSIIETLPLCVCRHEFRLKCY